MQAKIVATFGWVVLAVIVGSALYALVEAALTRRHKRDPASAARAEARQQRLGGLGCLPALLALVLGLLGILPGTNAASTWDAANVARLLLLTSGGALLGLVLTPAITLGIWRKRDPNGFVEAGSIITIAIIVTCTVGSLIGAVLGVIVGLLL